ELPDAALGGDVFDVLDVLDGVCHRMCSSICGSTSAGRLDLAFRWKPWIALGWRVWSRGQFSVRLCGVSLDALPPGPSEPHIVQTLRWLTRPIAFLESCRRRYGDNFSVQFLSFQRPTV